MNPMQRKIFLVAAVLPLAAFGQLTVEQRIHDFQNLAAVYAKRYAPAEWKVHFNGFDLLDVRPWLERVRQTQTDIEFHEICAEYVASLDDMHSSYRAPGEFAATLGLSVDIYEESVLIETVDRSLLPLVTYQIFPGDELVSVDGKTVDEWISAISKLRRRGSASATRRGAADLITFRPQNAVPSAATLGDSAEVVIRHRSGELQTYTIPWSKNRLKYPGANPIPGVRTAAAYDPLDALNELWQWRTPSDDPMFAGEIVDEEGRARPRRHVTGIGSKSPPFPMFDGFLQRLGRAAGDFHWSGTFERDGLRLGYLRIPSFTPPSTAITELENEIRYLNDNTDGLIVDVMRNPGGGCYLVEAARRLMDRNFWKFGEEIRPTWDRVQFLQNALDAARMSRADQWVVDVYTNQLEQMSGAYREGRHRTDPIAACVPAGTNGAPVWEETPAAITYRKPLIVLIDDFSSSAAEIFASIMKDSGRAVLAGTRTTGGGGSVSSGTTGTYSESSASFTQSLVVRREPVSFPDAPSTRYIENVGVRADVHLDIMTKENFFNGRRTFTEGVAQALVNRIRAGQ